MIKRIYKAVVPLRPQTESMTHPHVRNKESVSCLGRRGRFPRIIAHATRAKPIEDVISS